MTSTLAARSSEAPLPPAAGHGQLLLSDMPATDFEALFREMSPYVLRVLPRMGVASADLDDVAQEIFLAVHRGLAGFEGRSQLRTWVYGICIRVCSSYRRRPRHRHEQPAFDSEHEHERVDPGPGPERTLEAQQALRALDRALDALPAPQRAAFVLYEIEALDMRDIAAAMDCSKFTAYARLYAARRHVCAALAGAGHLARDEEGDGR